MTELHTHILPGMDDGARDLEEALALLELERLQGTARIALTSHFRPDQMDLTEFLDRRAASAQQLRRMIGRSGTWPQLKTGCEIYFSPRLAELELQNLCLEGTDLLLLELPTGMQPRFFRETLEELGNQGFTPLIAHAERYGYILDEPGILAEWMELGVFVQINASSLIRGGERAEMCQRLIKWGLAHVVSSDTHSTDRRPPNLDRAMAAVRKQLGQDTVLRLENNARTLFEGGIPELAEPHRPRKFFGRWI